jgi:hypothetical protein
MKTTDEMLYEIVCVIEQLQEQIKNINEAIALLNKRIDLVQP